MSPQLCQKLLHLVKAFDRYKQNMHLPYIFGPPDVLFLHPGGNGKCIVSTSGGH